jgi:hypothetical protein
LEGLNPKIKEGKEMEKISPKNGMQKPWKAKVIEGIQNGENIIKIMNRLGINPYGFGLLNILKELKGSVPREKLEEIIEQAKPVIGEKRAKLFKREI